MSRRAAGFVPLWCRTNFSFLDGASFPDEIVSRALESGCEGVALTDLDGLGGIVEAWVELNRTPPNRPFAFIIGAEVTVARSLERAAPLVGVDSTRAFTVLLLATTRHGYGNLSELISRGRLRSEKGTSIVTIEEVAEFSTDLLLIWTERSGVGSDLDRLVPHFPDRMWVGISRHLRASEERSEARLLALAHGAHLPIVALPRVLYHDRSRRALYDVMRCIESGTTLDEAADRLPANAGFALPEPRTVARLYHDHPEWIAETRKIADRCSFSLAEIEYRYPSETRPDGWSDIGWLRELTRRGVARRYPGGANLEVGSQIERELELIEELDYAGYFLTMAEIVMFCRREGILCQGRGSAANSAVCYCLGITAIDPIKMNLLFERFISRERAEPPDIDLDIEHRRREEVIQHVYEHYGRDRAAMVANIVRFRRRSAVREVGKVFGFSEVLLDQLAKLLGYRSQSVDEAVQQCGLDAASPRVAAFLGVVKEMYGMPRHLSIHPGGFLLGRDPVARIVPQENATMPGRTVVQWDKHGVEGMNLFKVDLLGLGALTHLDFAFRLLDEYLGVSVNMATIPMDAPRVYAMLRAADTVGVFQLESRAQMAMLPRLEPREFYDLVVEVSIVRPGPITGGMVHPYLRRRRGEEPVEYPHPDLEPVLRKTLGVPLFQEQVMKLAMVAADYTPGEADQLRRDMAAWRHTGRIEQHQDKIIERMVGRGIKREFAERVFEQIRGFGEYGFPESHAASFSLIAYAGAWVRAYYPTVFTCALLNAWPMGFYSPATIVSDARRHGIKLRPVDALASEWACTLERVASARSDESYAIRMGMRFVKGLSKAECDRIRKVRRREHWSGTGSRGLARFLRVAAIDADARVVLSRAGAFRSFDAGRRDAVWQSLDGAGEQVRANEHGATDRLGDFAAAAGAEAADAAHTTAGESAGSQTSPRLQTAPAAASPEPSTPADELIAREEQPDPLFTHLESFEAVAWDYLSSIHSTAAHPLEPYRSWLDDRAYPSAEEVREAPHDATIAVIGMVICRQMPDTAGGTVFLTLEDETGFINLVVWRRTFDSLRTVLLTGSFLGVRGRVQRAEGVVHLIVEDAWHARLPATVVSTGSREFH